MPYVNIKITGGSEAPSAERKAELVRGATELTARLLGKKTRTAVVSIDEVKMNKRDIGGKSDTMLGAEAPKN